MADDLASRFDPAVANALFMWAAGKGVTATLTAEYWQPRGMSGAVLAAIKVVSVGHRRRADRMIVKVCPAGHAAEEAGRHEIALQANHDFAQKHLVYRPAECYPVGDGRELMFHGIPAGLKKLRTIGEWNVSHLPNLCGRVARLVVQDWNRIDRDGVREDACSPDAYLRDELGPVADWPAEMRDWFAAAGLFDEGADWITTGDDGASLVLPNPVRMVLPESALDIHGNVIL